MDAEILSRMKIQDTERELRRIRLASAAGRFKPRSRPTSIKPRHQAFPAVPARLLRAIGLAS